MEEQLYPVAATKRCCTCNIVKPLEDFNRLTRSKDGRQPRCRECHRAHHYANWDRHMAQIRRRRNEVREKARALVLEHLRSHPCVDCGETDILVLEFDHLRDKRDNISRMIHDSELWRIVDEIAKCEVVCSNCHRRRTARRGAWYRLRSD